MNRHKELGGLLLLLILGLAPRLAWVIRFPTIPYSDFATLVSFGIDLQTHGLLNHTSPWFWESFNPGLPLLLSALFRMAASVPPATVARLATAIVCGVMPLLPFFVWRGVRPLWVRMLASIALAVWPGQVLFSGVVAQDSWVLLPTVALGALAVRALLSGEPARPVVAGLLYVAGAAIRQEMLVVLFPLFLVAAGVRWWPGRQMAWRSLAAATLAVGVPLLGLAAYRGAATGRFALTTLHSGVTTLGSYVPGATANGWSPPYAFIASEQPDLMRDRRALLQSSGLVVREALRRPVFHATRILWLATTSAVSGEAGSLYWSVGAPEVLPESLRQRGAATAAAYGQPLVFEMAALQGLFLAALLAGIWRRNTGILLLASAVLLKYTIHAMTSALARHFFPATALEILAIALAAAEVRSFSRSHMWRLAAAGMAFAAALFLGAPRLEAFVKSQDRDPQQRTYRFYLLPPGLPWHETTPINRYTELGCTVNQGTLVELWPQTSATLRAPVSGDHALAVCQLTGQGEPRPLMLQVLSPGAGPLHRLKVDGVEVSGTPVNLPLGNVGAGTQRQVVVEAEGSGAQMTFQLARSSPAWNLALGKPAAQSSTLPGSTGARAAVSGSTDGGFFGGSVTSTNRDLNAWWEVDLGASVPVGSVVIWNRTDCCGERLEDFWVFLSDTPFQPTDTPAVLKTRTGIWSNHQTTVPLPSVRIAATGARGRYVRVQLSGTNHLSLAEVQVFGDYR